MTFMTWNYRFQATKQVLMLVEVGGEPHLPSQSKSYRILHNLGGPIVPGVQNDGTYMTSLKIVFAG